MTRAASGIRQDDSQLSQALNYVRQRLDPALPVGDRLRMFWAAVVAARDLGASDVVESEFIQLARDTGLHRELGRNADADLRHIFRLALLGSNPFQ